MIVLGAMGWALGPGRVWVGTDNIQPGIYAIHLLRDWNWHLFETLGQTPSTGSYLCAFFLKMGLTPALAYALPSVAAATGAVTLASWAVQRIFSIRLAFLFFCLLGFNAWTFRVSRDLILLPLWESLLLCALVLFLSKETGGPPWIRAGLLGLVLGLGPFAFPSWPVMVPPILILLKDYRKGPRDPLVLSAFLFSLILGLAPFLVASAREGYGGHILKSAFWNGPSWIDQLKVIGDYLQGVFGWGHPASMGGTGFLDVFSRAFFLVGTLEMMHSRKDPVFRWIALVFFLAWIPGFLTNTVEFNRVLLALPFLFLISAMGIEALVSRFPVALQNWGLIFLLLLPYLSDCRAGFPSYTLGTVITSIEEEEEACYRSLEPLSRELGPGWILSEFTPQPRDYSLNYYSYPFNAALNPSLSSNPVRWCAIFTETHYEPYLRKEFPEAHWRHFGGSSSRLSRDTLAWIPLEGSNQGRLRDWKDFHSKIEKIDFAILGLPNGRSRSAILAALKELYAFLPTDPFLRSLYFEKLAFNYSWEKTFHPEDLGTNWTAYGGIFKELSASGVQNASIYEQYGKLLASEGREGESQKALRKALQYSPGNPWLVHELTELSAPKDPGSKGPQEQ